MGYCWAIRGLYTHTHTDTRILEIPQPGYIQEGEQLMRHDEGHRKFSFSFSVHLGVDRNLDVVQVLGYICVSVEYPDVAIY